VILLRLLDTIVYQTEKILIIEKEKKLNRDKCAGGGIGRRKSVAHLDSVTSSSILQADGFDSSWRW